MIAAAIIVLREVFEAALIIGIVLAATRGVAHRGRRIVGGIALGLAGSVVMAAFAEQLAGALEGMGQEIFNAGILLTATIMLGWHNIWMRQHGAGLARDMQAVGREITAGTRPLSVLSLVIGLAVLREGSEVVLFLYGIAAGGTGAGSLLIGSLLGLAGGVAIGALLYFGLLSIPTRHLFAVTGALMLLLAAGMAGQAAGLLVQAGRLPALADPLWNTSSVLPEHSMVGQVLHALIGYAERPSGMQIVFFVCTALGLEALMSRFDRSPPAATTRAAITGLFVLFCAGAALSPAPAQAAHVIYSPVVEEGELAVEWRAHHDFDSRNEAAGAERHKLEIEYTPNAFWRTELLGEWEKEPGESREATEIAWENVFQLTPQGKYWADVGLLAEYARSLESGGEDAIELGLLAEKQFASTVLTANLLAEREFAGGADTAIEYAARYRWRWSERFEPGLELHGELGAWGHFGRVGDHDHQLGPSLLGKTHAGTHSAFRYEAAVLFGLTDDSPDTTVRLQLEFEF